MRRIYLCRHGKTAWNAERRIQGLNDIELNGEGREQARALASFLKKHVQAPVRIVSSPLLRAKQTANEIASAFELPVETDQRIIEINTGIFTGKRMDDLITDEAWQAHLRNPWDAGYGEGGESAEAVRDRVMSLIHAAIASNDERDLLLVTHASPITRLWPCSISRISTSTTSSCTTRPSPSLRTAKTFTKAFTSTSILRFCKAIRAEPIVIDARIARSIHQPAPPEASRLSTVQLP